MHRCASNEPVPLRLPDARDERVALMAMRRMAVLGRRDSSTALLLLTALGSRYLGALSALRTFMFRLQVDARRPLRLAGCCARHMTADEADMLLALREAVTDPIAAWHALERLLGDPEPVHAMRAAERYGAAVYRMLEAPTAQRPA